MNVLMNHIINYYVLNLTIFVSELLRMTVGRYN